MMIKTKVKIEQKVDCDQYVNCINIFKGYLYKHTFGKHCK